MREIRYTAKFRKDYKRLLKQQKDMTKLAYVLHELEADRPLDAQYRDHALQGDYFGHRECHIEPDWLLIYRIENETLVLTAVRTGSHSDLF